LGKGVAGRVFGQLGCYATTEIEISGKRVDQAHWTIEAKHQRAKSCLAPGFQGSFGFSMTWSVWTENSRKFVNVWLMIVR
jgi:hypothetical protein